MSQQKIKTKNKLKEKSLGNKQLEKKPLINPRYKNTFWTIVTIIVLTIFFIVNNTKSEREKGDYPPNYNSFKDSIPQHYVDPRVSVIIESKDSIN